MDRDSLSVASATGVDVSLPIAGAGSRSYAFLIDWHVRMILAMAWVSVALQWAGIGFLRPASGPGGRAALIAFLPAVLLYLLYHPVLEVLMKGRTPGRRMAGVRLVTRTGGTPSTGAFIVRNLFRLIDCLPGIYLVGLICTLVTRDHVRIGDMAAGTLLVHDAGATASSLASFAELTRVSGLDPVLLDVGADLLRRWDELIPERRARLTRSFIARLQGAAAADALSGLTDPLLRQRLTEALSGPAPAPA